MAKVSIRAFAYVIGLIILSISVSLIIKSDLGAGSWDALNVGLAETVGLTVGTWVILVGIVLIVVNAFLMKRKPDFFSLITILLIGSLLDFSLLFVMEQWIPTSWLEKAVAFSIGAIMLALGVSIYLQAKFAPVPIDNLMVAIHRRTGLSIRTSKTIGEVVALILAFMFGGPVGIGTILITFSIGPLVQFFFPKVEKMLYKREYS